MKRSRVLALLAIASGNALACQLILGLDDHRLTVPVDAAVRDDAAECPHKRRPPGPPVAPDDGAKKTYVFAGRAADFTSRRPDGGTIGYDLDGVCTCDPRDTSARAGKPSCIAPSNSASDGGCDSEDGVDNALAAVPELDLFFGDAGTLTTEANCGRSTILVVVEGYNGQKEDPSVQIGLMPSFGIYEGRDGEAESPECAATSTNRPRTAIGAHWDGEDIWSTRTSDINDKTGLPEHTYPGYVRDWQLVMDTASTKLGQSVPLVLQGAIVEFGTPILTATLVPSDAGSGFDLVDGILTGRLTTRDFIDWFGARPVSIELSPTQVACDAPGFKNAVRPVLCSLVDTVMPASNDFNDLKCNAVSLALRFRAQAARLGSDRYDVRVTDASCSADPANTCDVP
jgi:hypothetical protein